MAGDEDPELQIVVSDFTVSRVTALTYAGLAVQIEWDVVEDAPTAKLEVITEGEELAAGGLTEDEANEALDEDAR